MKNIVSSWRNGAGLKKNEQPRNGKSARSGIKRAQQTKRPRLMLMLLLEEIIKMKMVIVVAMKLMVKLHQITKRTNDLFLIFNQIKTQ